MNETEVAEFQAGVAAQQALMKRRIPADIAQVQQWAARFAAARKDSLAERSERVAAVVQELWTVFGGNIAMSLPDMILHVPPMGDDTVKLTLTTIALVRDNATMIRLLAERELLFTDYTFLVNSLSLDDTFTANRFWYDYRSLCEQLTGTRIAVMGDLLNRFAFLPVVGVQEGAGLCDIRFRANPDQIKGLRLCLDRQFF